MIIDLAEGDDITSFTAVKGKNEVEFSPKKTDGYAILKDDYILGVIEVVEDLEIADIKEIREKYLP